MRLFEFSCKSSHICRYLVMSVFLAALVVNGTGSPGDNIWCTTISGTANTDYYFSGWISTLNPLGTPQIQVSVNGILVGTQFNAGGTPCNWEFFDASFYSGASATFDICVTTRARSS